MKSKHFRPRNNTVHFNTVGIFTKVMYFLQLVIPLKTQDDLDKAVELLDRSVHMKSLKILLVLQMSSQVSTVC